MNQKETQPLVSFILTYYNLPIQMLCECINSIMVLSLSSDEREIIVIDDGSEVSPMNGLMQYGDEIIYVRQKNQGLSVARNKGIEMATGQYIQFVDADDHLIKSPYEHCLDIVRFKDPDIVTFHLSNKEEHMVPNEVEGPMEGADYMRRYNLRSSACGYIFRKFTLVNLRFTSGILHEDEEFTHVLAEFCIENEERVDDVALAQLYRN